ncbi:peptidoglycan-binding domain-containing protein [Plantactinospora sp. CA-294935]|uniref:peptidoglycan-binding domain-containing protein n=1 Tax=Plantactinospora sp. CA-294935 TaxID=3240012 RepID=UPI003D91127C
MPVKRLSSVLVGALAAVALLLGVVVAPAQASPNVGNIGLGSSNAAGVRCVQAGLNYVGGAGLDVDTIFGQATKRAVENFQRFFGLSVDGIVGKATGTTLIDMVNYKAGYPMWPHGGGCWSVIPTYT